MSRRLCSKIFGGIEMDITNVAVTYDKDVMSARNKTI